MKKTIWVVVAALAIVAVSWPAKASTTWDGITYSFTNTGMDGSNVYDVALTMDTSGALDTGYLSAFSVQFTGATLVAFDPLNGYPNWSPLQKGTSTGPAPTDCNFNGSANHWCTEWIGSGTAPAVPDAGTLTFNFDVTMPLGTSLPTVAGIQAFQGQGDLAISNNVPFDAPEPSTLAFLGIGLFGLVVLSGRRLKQC